MDKPNYSELAEKIYLPYLNKSFDVFKQAYHDFIIENDDVSNCDINDTCEETRGSARNIEGFKNTWLIIVATATVCSEEASKELLAKFHDAMSQHPYEDDIPITPSIWPHTLKFGDKRTLVIYLVVPDGERYIDKYLENEKCRQVQQMILANIGKSST